MCRNTRCYTIHMESFYTQPVIKTEKDALTFFKRAIKYRNNHKDEYREIARFVYDNTHDVPLSRGAGWISSEFIALEAPGMPPDDTTDPDEYIDQLWRRLDMMTDAEIKKQTV